MAAGVTVAKNENGKRDRNQMETEDSEFAPLSKRINNLHLHQSHQNGHASHQQQQEIRNGVHHVDNSGCSSTLYSNFNGSGLPSSGHEQQNTSHYSHHNHHHHHNSVSQRGEHYDVRSHGMLPNSSHHQNMNSSRVEHNGLPSSHQEPDLGQQNGVSHHGYSPALDSSSNPHYYEPNKQLYMLYLERMSRTGQRLHPQFYE